MAVQYDGLSSRALGGYKSASWSVLLALEMAKIRSNQDYYKDISGVGFLSLDKSTIVSPRDQWPTHSGKPWAASDLKMATHFEVESTNSQLVPLIEKFPGGIIEEAQMPSISSDEKYIEVELLHITADILESTVLLKHSREVKELSEAEVRFSVVDPILKGICKFTMSLISLEEAVCDSDATIHSEDSSVSTLLTPSYQKQTSKRVLPDYTVYFITSQISKAPVILLTEVKKKKKFNDDSIVQAIGYYTASRESAVSGRHGSPKPPLAVVFCQDEVRFILFPFTKDNEPCVNAVVTPPLKLMKEDGKFNPNIFTFICAYVKYAFHVNLDVITKDHLRGLEIDIQLKTKKSFESLLITSEEKLREEIKEAGKVEAREEIREILLNIDTDVNRDTILEILAKLQNKD